MDFKLPELGEGIESGDVLTLLVKEGDLIAAHQALLELETDKATVEVPCPQAGKVVKLHVAEGQTIKIGAILATIEPSGAAAQATSPATPVPAPVAATPPPPSTLPSPAPAKVTPAPVAMPAPAVAHAVVAPAARGPAAANGGLATHDHDDHADGDASPAGPATRRFARELGVDLARVRGSGPDGRITREDIINVVRQQNQPTALQQTANQQTATLKDPWTGPAPPPAPARERPAPVAPPSAAATPASTPGGGPGEPDQDAWGPIRREVASRTRRTIAARMHQSWSTIPRVTNFDDADVTELEAKREESKADYALSGIKLTTLPFLMKAVALSLRKHPLVNASYDEENGVILYKDYVHLGIAVDSDRGLVVPVVRHADRQTIPDLARQLAAVVQSVRTNSFTLDDLRGGTFSISNLGSVGGTYSTPIINHPEVAILLAGRARKLPVVIQDELAIRLLLPLSLSYDHRLVDGATAARFLNDVIAYLESPSRLLLAP